MKTQLPGLFDFEDEELFPDFDKKKEEEKSIPASNKESEKNNAGKKEQLSPETETNETAQEPEVAKETQSNANSKPYIKAPVLELPEAAVPETSGQEPEAEVPQKSFESPAETDQPEWKLDKNYYAIGEVAEMFDVNVSHIRFWTTEFKIKTRTTRKGNRLYTPEQIAELRLIHHLVKVKRHTLKGAKEILKSGSWKVEQKLDLRTELDKLSEMLLEIKAAL